MNVGWIGLGKMGLPMSKCMELAGHSITVFARSAASAAKAAGAGYEIVLSLAELAEKSDVVISAISDDAALLDVAGEQGLAAHLKAGQTYIETSTVSPGASAVIASAMSAKGVHYLRSPVSGSTATAKAAALTAIVSGPRTAFEAHLPLFESFTKASFWIGDGEQARYMKLAINSTLASIAALLAEGLAFAQKGGISLSDAIEIYSKSAVATPLLEYKRATILEGKYDPAFEVTQIMKDLDLALMASRTIHAPLPMAGQVRQQYETAFLKGLGARDFFVLVKEAAELAGIDN